MLKIEHGDCLDILKTLPDKSVDSIVTDPPYGLSFMGKKWDYDVPSVEVWAECLRVLKPGGHLLAFAGTRTQHRMAVRIEDAGFEIRDMIAWVYGSGFPKSRNLDGDWQGWGTALKPALEPITVARKPLVGTVAENVLAHGTGGLNIDGCRVATEDNLNGGVYSKGFKGASFLKYGGKMEYKQPTGRWPANLIHDGSDEVVAVFPSPHGAGKARNASDGTHRGYHDGVTSFSGAPAMRFGDTGSASRFFYCAKASKRDRDEGLDGFEKRNNMRVNGPRKSEEAKYATKLANIHPTVKPTDLMRYLCRLVTPPNGVVLDPFMGSGSTGKAAKLEGFSFIGIEKELEYVNIAKSRIQYVDSLSSGDLLWE